VVEPDMMSCLLVLAIRCTDQRDYTIIDFEIPGSSLRAAPE